MPERLVHVKDHLLEETNTYLVNRYYPTLIGMVGAENAKKLMMEAVVYKKKSFIDPRSNKLYTISYPTC